MIRHAVALVSLAAILVSVKFQPGPASDFPAARYLRAALDVVKGVDAGAIARAVQRKSGLPAKAHSDAIALAVRAARLAALRAWKRVAGA